VCDAIGLGAGVQEVERPMVGDEQRRGPHAERV
jgi:hypothetical protein